MDSGTAKWGRAEALSFRMSPQKPVGEVLETTSMFYTDYGHEQQTEGERALGQGGRWGVSKVCTSLGESAEKEAV